MTSIDEALNQGARQAPACAIMGINQRTYQRWKLNGYEDKRQTVTKIAPSNKLTAAEKAQIITLCNNEEFASCSIKQIVPTLADRGVYIASESSFYRVLREANQMNHRGKSKSPRTVTKPQAYTANGANQIWSWDITYLASTIKGMFYYLYMMVDIYSRKIVGWEVYECESSDYAAEVLIKAKLKENLSSNHKLILHSDNGSPMKGATMLATMQSLGVTPSFSRPAVSNDNPYSEALFKTLKYTPSYPENAFGDIEQARIWVSHFVNWYNKEHRHSGLKYVTPEQRHLGLDVNLLQQREQLYFEAKARNPSRWSGNTRNWQHEALVHLNRINNDDNLSKISA
ncbi:transposase [Cysteiniphilum litorale]|uniref:Transposase n=2 Tax=Fastidiosibacteraceae TaxID=2056687 RepID=A0A8J2Z7A7_9GAMM|nr:transposase [Cysteiniphilum litorale]